MTERVGTHAESDKRPPTGDLPQTGEAAREGGSPQAENLAALFASLAPRAVSVLVSLMQDEGQKPELRMKAAESILDRACGKSGGAPPDGSSAVIVFEGELEKWSR